MGLLSRQRQLQPNGGRTHWSLLVYHRGSNHFAHYDSQNGSNSLHARRIANKLEAFLGAGRKAAFAEEQCPSQQNSYDCGMYVMCIAEVLCERVRAEGSPRLSGPPSAPPTSRRREQTDLKITIYSVASRSAGWIIRDRAPIHSLSSRCPEPRRTAIFTIILFLIHNKCHLPICVFEPHHPTQ
ncbi:hypothetical protein WMY93_012577 [Mugilogobius chulae]|uniref:Ubiquitin-like protease family profile domain-containing protein n=1 Tax=Mugilogobius chulae TaxID=88201 RepID=A0AAW0NXG4_9GOBI